MEIMRVVVGTVTLTAADAARTFDLPSGVVAPPSGLFSRLTPTDPVGITKFHVDPRTMFTTVDRSGRDVYVGAHQFALHYTAVEDVEVAFVFVWVYPVLDDALVDSYGGV